MSEFITFLALLAYGTAAVVGVQLVASSVSRLSGLVVHWTWRPDHPGEEPLALAALTGLVLLLAGLFLLLQGMVVAVWAFG